MKKDKRVKAIILGIVIILLYLLLHCCVGKRKEGLDPKGEVVEESMTGDQKVLQKIRFDGTQLKGLFERGDICSEEWVKDVRKVIDKMKETKYEGKDEGIKELVEGVHQSAKELEEIIEKIEDKKYEEAIEGLEKLKESAIKIEGKLDEKEKEYFN